MRKLDASSATGPDMVSARVLKECAENLGLPVAKLLTRILANKVWPTLWLQHWIIPLYKKKSVFDANNYRGVHLTSQLSKVMERLLQQVYVPFLYGTIAYGPNQFAYLEGRGARDAIAFMVITWLMGFDKRLKFALLLRRLRRFRQSTRAKAGGET